MVDLHPSSPGLPEGHPWKEFPRWRMALHTLFGVMLLGLMGGLLTGLSALPNVSGYMGFLRFGSLAFGGCFAVFCAILAAIFGPWLRKFYPFTQALLFGGIATLSASLLVVLLSILESLIRASTLSEPSIIPPLDGAFLVILILGFPSFLAASIGYAFAVWSPTRRGRTVFWALLAVTTSVVATLFVLHKMFPENHYIGWDRTPQSQSMDVGPESLEVRPGVCGIVDGSGTYVEFPCDGLPFE